MLKNNNLTEPLEFDLQAKNRFFTLKHFIIMALDESVFGQIGKFHDFLGKKFDQITPKANRKTFFREIMSANKRLNSQINSQNEQNLYTKAKYIADEVATK